MLIEDATPPMALLEQSSEAVFVVDQAGVFQRVSAGLANVLGYPAARLVGTPLLQYVVPAEAARARQHLGRAAAGEVLSYEASLLGAAGAVPLSFCLFALGLPAQPPAGVYGLARLPAPASAATVALLERERHLSVIFDTIADVTFVLDVEADGRYRFMFVNKAFEKTTGLTPAKVVGSYVQDIIPEPSLTLVLEKYRQAVATGQRVVWQETSDYPTGQVVGEVSVTPVLDQAGRCCQLVGIVHDLTEQKRAEESLRVSNERFQYALKATTEAIYDWNIAADTLYWGEGYEELFGHRLAQNPTPFSYWADYVHPQEHERVVTGLRHTAYETPGSFWQQEYQFRRADGSWAVVFDRGYLVRDAEGRPVRMIGAMQDITQRKEAEERQRLMAEKLAKQNADLQQFTYIISHNLRAPLANALGFADLLSRIDKNSAVFDDSLRNLRTSIQRLDEVLTDLNDVLSIRDRQDGYRSEPVAVAAVCQQALAGLLEPLRECGGTVHCDIAPTLRVAGSRAYFHSIFHNLLSNAIKYRSDARPLRVEVRAEPAADGSVTITVADNGSGFDPALAAEGAFQLYQRFHTDQPGRGIGLFLVKTHVESMDGRIEVQSQVGEGSRFILYFRPRADEDLPD